jgi:predicted GNAT family acetyltransferase
MLLKTYENSSDFLARTQPELEKEEAANNLMIGICLRLVRDPNSYQAKPILYTVEKDRDQAAPELVLAVVQTPPHNLILHVPSGVSKTDLDEALDQLGRQLEQDGTSVPGVLGRSEVARAFAAFWSHRTGCQTKPGMRERAYELRKVILPAGVPGRMRKAVDADTALVVEWTNAFSMEIFGHVEGEVTPEEAGRRVRAMYLWEDETGRVVSLAGSTRETPHGASVGPVYTPRELRGHGYASACVAALSQTLLDSGKAFCALFTDLANPISNHIYQEIGYRPLCDFEEHLFGNAEPIID